MPRIMYGKEVLEPIKIKQKNQVNELKKRGIIPQLAILRVGEKPADISYETSAKRTMEQVGVRCKTVVLSDNISQEKLEEAFDQLNDDPKVHGILLLRPLKEGLSEERILRKIHPMKDVDGMCSENISNVFLGKKEGMAPCTAQAVIEMLSYYDISLEGQQVVILGRSAVVGRPLAMLLLKENATVTMCHSRTNNLELVLQNANIIVSAVGKPAVITGEMVPQDVVAVDVGMSVNKDGKLCGDFQFEEVAQKASYISPVPGGLGRITTAVLADHVIRSAQWFSK